MRSEDRMPAREGRASARSKLRFAAFSGLILASIVLPASAQTLLFADFPRGEVFPDSTVRIVVAAVPPARAPESCGLYQGPVPAGTRLDWHPFKIRATALDYSGVGRVSNVFLLLESPSKASEDDLRGQ